MEFIADLHIHSKYSRAVSKDMTLEEIDRWAGNKGILLIGTGDFTHPGWFSEIKEKLEPAEDGFLKLKNEYKRKTISGKFAETRFVLSVEISSIYSKFGKTRRIHNVIFAPSIDDAEKINVQLSWIGNLSSDGRPILGVDSEELAKIIFDINPMNAIIPAHIWTPWFSLYGSMSGFDSMEECFGEYAKNIIAVETGLSSDPPMNWMISELDRVALVSNSDSHSARKIGREANIFNTEFSYKGMFDAIKNSSPNNIENAPENSRISSTIEFFPEEGRYHFDGHRNCGVCFSPEESEKHKKICPKCGKPLTIGVMSRVKQLADRPFGYKDSRRTPYESLVPLEEIISEAVGVGVLSKKVNDLYEGLIRNFGDELSILRNVKIDELAGFDERIADGIKTVRDRLVKISPGYDGEYGKISIFGERNAGSSDTGQKTLF